MNKAEKYRFGAVIVAGGSSCRFGTKNKLFEVLAGIPVFILAIQPFIEICAGRIILVVHPENKLRFAKIAEEYLPSVSIRYVVGGSCRPESVLNGLSAFSPDEIDFVAIHDAARPLLDCDSVRAGFDFACVNGSAVFSSKITDTVKYLKSLDSAIISKTVDRDYLWAAETPQIFRFAEILKAYNFAVKDLKSFTDDSSIMEAAGFEVKIFPSPFKNIKVTIEQDIILAEALLRKDIGK